MKCMRLLKQDEMEMFICNTCLMKSKRAGLISIAIGNTFTKEGFVLLEAC